MGPTRNTGTKTFHERLRFETLLADLSARFVNLPADLVDGAIQDAQQHICHTLGLDASTLWQLRDDHPNTLYLTHYHFPPDTPPIPAVMDAQAVSPWCLQTILKGEVVIVPRISETPPEAERDRELWRHYGIQSVLSLPLSAGGGPTIGALSFTTQHKERDWSPELVSRLWLVAQIFSNTLARKQSEERLKESEERLRLATSAAGAGLWTLNGAQSRFWINPTISELFGLPPGDALEVDRFIGLIHPEDRALVSETLAQAPVLPSMTTVEYRIIRPDGTVRWMLSRGCPLTSMAGGGGNRLMGLTFDITERKQGDIEAAQLRHELAHVTRVSTLGELAASLAHELNQPLAAILSNAQAARRFLNAPAPDLDDLREILGDIIKDNKRAGEVIHRLRALVQKKAPVGLEPIDLNEIIHDTRHLVNSELIGRNITLSQDLAPCLPPVRAGRVELQQVLLNLLVNAMDAVRDMPSERRRIRLKTESGATLVTLAVQDQGAGIPTERMEDIFRPFFTTKPQGLGMGLTVSRSLIETFGGRLRGENAPDGGALFRIDLPALSPPNP